MAHLLLPTDFSDQSLKAATLAIDLFGSKGNQFTLVHSYNAAGLADPLVPGALPDLHKIHSDGLEEFEQKLRSKCDLASAKVNSIVAFGPLSGVIDDAAKEKDVDLVVMASSRKVRFVLLRQQCNWCDAGGAHSCSRDPNGCYLALLPEDPVRG
ncbi:MAG: universal stress protein [Flavobacteriales bacterium]|nr:universal stress protein [Flavobacteriales bacterium]